jgi:mRNA interferase RelE/StbE
LSYKIAFKKSVSRDLKKIDKEQAKRILNRIDDELISNADKQPLLSGKFAGLRKFRVGEYRIIYTIIENTVLVLRISHRREA